MAEQNVEVVKGMYDAFGRGDVPAVLGGMAEDIEWNEAAGMPQGGTYRGPGAVAENVSARSSETFRTLGRTRRVHRVGPLRGAIVRYTGTGKATGKKLDLPAVHVGIYATARSRVFASSWTW